MFTYHTSKDTLISIYIKHLHEADMTFSFIPRWLAAVPPQTYVALGGGVAVLSNDKLTVVSGAALAVAGTLLWISRRSEQRRKAKLEAEMEARLRSARKKRLTGS